MAGEVAGKYIEMAGGTPTDVSSITENVRARLDEMSAAAAAEATINLRFEPNGHGVAITVASGPDRSVIRHPLMAKKG
jgi:hypothetical protein